MSTALDIRLVPRVLTLVTKYGVLVNFRIPQSNQYNVSEGEAEPLRPVKYRGYITPPARDDKAGESTDVQSTMLTYLAASGLTFTPAVGQILEFDSKDWTITDVDPIYTGEDIALYGLTVEN